MNDNINLKKDTIGYIEIRDLPILNSTDNVSYFLVLDNTEGFGISSLLDKNKIILNIENYYTKSQLNTQLASYIKKDGSVPLTADWNLGSFRIKSLPAIENEHPVTYGQLKTMLQNPYIVNTDNTMFEGYHDNHLVKYGDLKKKVINFKFSDYVTGYIKEVNQFSSFFCAQNYRFGGVYYEVKEIHNRLLSSIIHPNYNFHRRNNELYIGDYRLVHYNEKDFTFHIYNYDENKFWPCSPNRKIAEFEKKWATIIALEHGTGFIIYLCDYTIKKYKLIFILTNHIVDNKGYIYATKEGIPFTINSYINTLIRLDIPYNSSAIKLSPPPDCFFVMYPNENRDWFTTFEHLYDNNKQKIKSLYAYNSVEIDTNILIYNMFILNLNRIKTVLGNCLDSVLFNEVTRSWLKCSLFIYNYPDYVRQYGILYNMYRKGLPAYRIHCLDKHEPKYCSYYACNVTYDNKYPGKMISNSFSSAKLVMEKHDYASRKDIYILEQN